MEPSEPPSTKETVDAAQERPSSPGEPGRLSLLVLEGSSSSIVPLPRDGTLDIGRGAGVELLVQDASVSRRHARLRVVDGEARIADLNSHNGVRVNGELISGEQVLRNGDVAMLGDVTLVFQRRDIPPPQRLLLDAATLRDRLAEELERVLRYERAMSVVALALGPTDVPLVELVRALGGGLRVMDLVGRGGPTQLLVLLPELTADEVEEVVQPLLESLAPLAPEVRAGVASAPQDGLDADTLISAARTVALAAPSGGLRLSGPDLYQLPLGERSVMVADEAMVRLFELLRRLASSPIPVLIHGETGAGKENAAWAVHHWSPRAQRPFIALNCSALPESLVESELFGAERGAFSGAVASRAGLLERASGGTLFLDEVAELPLSVQAKLLRALDQQRITRLGDSRERAVDLRIVAATHRVLADEVKAGRFRQDLFFRLSASVVTLPPLRNRPRELPLLATRFLQEALARVGRTAPRISAAAMEVLRAHPWPGNVRELKNVMEYAATTATGPLLEASHLPDSLQRPPGDEPTPPSPAGPAQGEAPGSFRSIAEEVRELEYRRMREALEATGGVQTRAAQLIGMPLRTFKFKARRYQLPRPRAPRE
ncbi:sigma 54-interacting transcriptional regulator [Pyxidicoccus caerfyrddinensis]|uniref:sigma 54-interacting transcriptional regulator n=1 Tax=Pyxidicoccus caerfyrddinensis TaxID=2709663 RepID=UPI001F073170|nr:sigma 54-interacting transcriptional regulator [Pyxidicoccus caerfyrddinensis]